MSFESLRNIIFSPQGDKEGAKKENTRTASEIVKDKKDAQYFSAFLTQCGNSDDVKEAYRKQLAHEPLTPEEAGIVGDAVRQFEENIKTANELYEQIYRSPYFESFFKKFETTYNHIVTPQEFKKQFLDHLRMLAVTGGDAVKEFSDAFNAYERSSVMNAEMERESIKLSKHYGFYGAFSTLTKVAQEEGWTSDQIKAKMQVAIQEKYPGTTTESAKNILNIILKSPDGVPIEKVLDQSGVQAVDALKRLYTSKEGETEETKTVFTEALSEIGQTGKAPKRPEEYSAKEVVRVKERTPLQFSDQQIGEMRVEYQSFKKDFIKNHQGYENHMPNDSAMIDMFFTEKDSTFDTKTGGGKRKIGWLERFLRNIRNTYLKGKIKN